MFKGWNPESLQDENNFFKKTFLNAMQDVFVHN